MAGVVTKIATGTPSGVYDLTFAGISGSYDDLLIIGSIKGSHTGGSAFSNCTLNMRFNGDTGANYFYLYQQAIDSSTKGSVQATGTNGMILPIIPTSTSSNTGWGQFRVLIPGYSDGSGNAAKRVSHLGGYGQGSHGSATTRGNHGWTSTAAITSVGFFVDWYNFVAGSTMTLYGITNA